MIEVGIDISNATVIVVEHAERFGLRSSINCAGESGAGASGIAFWSIVAPADTLAAERLRAMEKEHDGFKIAEADLKIRGPGELLGARQSGLMDFRFANLARDARLLAEARREALAWLEHDPKLREQRLPQACERSCGIAWGTTLQLGLVG